MTKDTKQETVEVPYGDNRGDLAVLLLAAAEELDYDPSVVRTTGDGFMVPSDVADEAGVQGENVEERATKMRLAAKSEAPAETIKGGAGPTGRTDSNAGEDAEQGTVQDTAAEGDAPRSNIETVNERVPKAETEQEEPEKAPEKKAPAKKTAAKKSENKE